MRRRPPHTPSDEAKVVSTLAADDRGPTRRRSRLASLVAALLVTVAPAAAQTRLTDETGPLDTLRRPTLRSTTTPRKPTTTSTFAPLRGSLGTRRTAEPLPADPVTPAADSGAAADGTAAVDTDPLALEPIGRPATPPRPATTAASATPPAAGTAAARRIDPATGLPLPADRAAPADRGPVLRTGTVKGGPVLPEAATQPRPRDALADKRDEAVNEPDDYAQLGLRTGGFTWLPAVEGSAGWSSNVAARAGGTSGMVYRVAPELIGRSDWSRHSLEFSLRGAYTGNTTDHAYDSPSFQGAMRGRVDLGDETTVDIKAGLSHERQSASSADNPANTVIPATVESKTASLGITRDVGLLALTLRGDIERSDYTGGTTSTGTTLGSEIQNNTRHVAALRATWGSKGSLRPFVEFQVSNRDYDDAIVAGSPRDSTGAAVKTGVVADLGPKLRGELSTGWGVERPDHGPLPDMSGWLLDGSLIWSPTRLTTVKLDAKTSFDATTLANSPGAITRSVALGVDHSLRANLVASAGVSIADKRYVAADLHEDTLSLTSGLTYKIDRNVRTFVKGGLTRFTSSSGGADYSAANVMVGVRLQR
jgi:hypothetical protein